MTQAIKPSPKSSGLDSPQSKPTIKTMGHQKMFFSQRLDDWLHSNQPKTILGLHQIVAEKSFAIILLILISPAALPMPTGGATHLFGIVGALLGLQMVIGRQTLWLPDRWRNQPIGRLNQTKTIPILIKFIRFCEHFSRPRLRQLTQQRSFLRGCGLLLALYSLGTATAVPLSGLDTLPGVGVVLMSLGIILEDIVFLLSGSLIGLAGIGLQILLGKATFDFITHFFK